MNSKAEGEGSTLFVSRHFADSFISIVESNISSAAPIRKYFVPQPLFLHHQQPCKSSLFLQLSSLPHIKWKPTQFTNAVRTSEAST